MPVIPTTCHYLFEQLPLAVYTTDREGYIDYFNEAALQLWESTPEKGKAQFHAFKKMFKADGFTPLPKEETPLGSLLLKGTNPEQEEVVCITEKGNRKFLVPNPRELVNEKGEIIGAVNILVDVTAKRLNEETSSKFEAIVQDSTDGIISKNLDGIVTSWNLSAERIFGYKEEEMVGKPIAILIPEDRMDEEAYILNKIRKGERVETFETKRVNKYGQVLDISLTISPVKNNQGQVIGASKIVRNITRQKQMQQKLEESELMFKTITHASPAALWMTDKEGNTVFLSETWLKWTGKPMVEQVNKGWLNMILEEDKKKISDSFNDCFSKRKKHLEEFRMNSREGELHWYKTEGLPYYGQNGNFSGFAGSVMDITDFKDLERRKDDFIVMASHELNTPVTSIQGYVQLLMNIIEEKGNDIPESSARIIKSSLNTMNRQVKKLTWLLGELLELSRIQTNQQELTRSRFKLFQLVEESVQDARLTTTRNPIIFRYDFQGQVYADRERLGQVVNNLLSNAIKYSREGGKVEVVLRKENEVIILAVCDEGIGISKSEQSRIFERFYRSTGKSEQTYPGFGVGLFIAREVVNAHGGRIKVESKKGKGSTFTVILPLESIREGII